MESNNLPPFYLGEEVEYVTGENMPKGTKVTVTLVYRYPCGCWGINHDCNKDKLIYEAPPSGLWRCYDCKCMFSQKTYTNLWDPSAFRSLQRPKPMTFIKLAEIQETEKEEVLTLN